MLEFKGDAICLSGVTGTKLKSEIIGEYYPFWWGIVSGGARLSYRQSTAIIELNAATGEVHIKDTDEILLGSAGHALKTKLDEQSKTRNLSIFLVEEEEECFEHLQNVLNKRWNLPQDLAFNSKLQEENKVFLFNLCLNKAIEKLEIYEFRHGLYFFDPLLFVEWEKIEKVARSRIFYPFKTGTEFIVFVFTSDWFQGRGDFTPLPSHIHTNKWTEEENKSVIAADQMFGNEKWRKELLTNKKTEDKESILIDLYKQNLLKWFRYVLALPFKPKTNQLYHLFFCSNYVDGIRATRNFYYKFTNSERFSPNNIEAYNRFKKLHPELIVNISGKNRPDEWKCLWQVIRNHEGGLCDPGSRNLKNNCTKNVIEVLKWLLLNNYLLECKEIESAWDEEWFLPRYILNWKKVKQNLDIDSPKPLVPITEINN